MAKDQDRSKLPMPDPPFTGTIGTTYQDSVGAWPEVYHYNFFEFERTVVESSVKLPEGASKVAFEFEYDGGGAGKGGEAVLFVNDKEVGRKRLERTVAGRFGIDTFGVGCDTGSPVCKEYKPPFPFTGVIEKVNILLGDPGLSEEEERVMQEKFHAGAHY